MQRPSHDKDYVQQCIKQLHKFLLSQGFPGTVTEKDIQSTTLEDLKKVTELIHALIHDEPIIKLSFQDSTNEFDEETLKMLKDLGYSYDPSTISTLPDACVVLWLAWISDWILEWYSDKMVYCLIEEVFFLDVSDEPCDVEEGAEFNKPLRRCLCDSHRTFMKRASVSGEKDEAFLDHLVTVMSLAETLRRKLENSCSSEAHKAAPENETAGQSEDQELVEVEHIRLILEKQKLTADTERSNREYNEMQRRSEEMEQKIQKSTADIERRNREQDELWQNIQREKQRIEMQNVADIERLNREKDELLQTLQRLEQTEEELKQQLGNKKMQKVTADFERLKRENDELLQTRQRLKRNIAEMEPKERNEKVTVSKTQKKKLRRSRRK